MARVNKQQRSSEESKKAGRQRRPEMSPEKREFLRHFVVMYDIRTAPISRMQSRIFSGIPLRTCSKRK